MSNARPALSSARSSGSSPFSASDAADMDVLWSKLQNGTLNMQEEALKLASHITHPVTVAAFALVFAAFALSASLKAKKPRLAVILAIAIVLLGLAPLAASTFLQSRGVYRVRVIVLGLDKQPVHDAEVTTMGGEIKKADGSWELEIPPQTRPADGKLSLFASVKDAFLAGSSTLVHRTVSYLYY